MKTRVGILQRLVPSCILFACGSMVQVQGQVTIVGYVGSPGGPPYFGAISATNVGGITYCIHSSAAAGTQVFGPVISHGNVLEQSLSVQVGEVQLPDYVTVQGVSVLGALPPGTNTFNFLFPTSIFGIGELTGDSSLGILLAVLPENEPTIIPAGSINGSPQFTVKGIQGVKYTIQESIDLTHWISVITNSGAPFNFSVPNGGDATNRFFRALIEAETPVITSVSPGGIQ